MRIMCRLGGAHFFFIIFSFEALQILSFCPSDSVMICVKEYCTYSKFVGGREGLMTCVSHDMQQMGPSLHLMYIMLVCKKNTSL